MDLEWNVSDSNAKKEGYYYALVTYEDDISEKEYYYIVNENIKLGDIVLVDRNDSQVFAVVKRIDFYESSKVPYPLEKTKRIVSLISPRFYTSYSMYSGLESNLFDSRIIFTYKFKDAFMTLGKDIIIFDKEKDNLIYRNYKDLDSNIYIQKIVTISSNDILKIKEIIKDSPNLFEIKYLEEHSVFDGTVHDFLFRSGDNINCFSGFNIGLFNKVNDLTINTCYLLNVLERIQKVLK